MIYIFDTFYHFYSARLSRVTIDHQKSSEEIKNASHALKELNCEIENIKNFNLEGTDNERNVLIIRKIKETNKKYPRKAGTPSKMPL